RLYDAALDGQPVVAITGMAYHDLIGTHTQQDVALDQLFADVAKFNQRIMGPSHVENVTHLACRTALAYRGVAHLTFPVDIQEMDAGAYRSKRNIKHHTSDVYARSARLPAQDELANAADLLNAGKKVAILAGRGALREGAPAQARGTGRQPLHDGLDRSPRHEALAGSAGGMRHAPDGRHIVSVHRVPAQARSGARRADRARSDADRAALSGRGGA